MRSRSRSRPGSFDAIVNLRCTAEDVEGDFKQWSSSGIARVLSGVVIFILFVRACWISMVCGCVRSSRDGALILFFHLNLFTRLA